MSKKYECLYTYMSLLGTSLYCMTNEIYYVYIYIHKLT